MKSLVAVQKIYDLLITKKKTLFIMDLEKA